MGEILATQNEYAKSLEWYSKGLEEDGENLEALIGAGLANFRCGAFEDADLLLTQAYAKNPFDAQTKNTLDLMDKVRRAETISQDAARWTHAGSRPGHASLAHSRSSQQKSSISSVSDLELFPSKPSLPPPPATPDSFPVHMHLFRISGERCISSVPDLELFPSKPSLLPPPATPGCFPVHMHLFRIYGGPRALSLPVAGPPHSGGPCILSLAVPGPPSTTLFHLVAAVDLPASGGLQPDSCPILSVMEHVYLLYPRCWISHD